MERKEFLKKSIAALGVAFVAPLTTSCEQSSVSTPDSMDKGSGPGESGSGSASSVTADTSCTVTPTETEGPFPTKTPYPSNYLRSDIRKGDGVGSTMVSTLTVLDVGNNCEPLEDVYVDIWQCDTEGEYSEYGGSRMQPDDYTDVSWLRGRQLTDATGEVTFTTIFPGWYQSRATHIHVHIFDKSGNSLLVTQIAFPDSLVKTVNTEGADYGYTKGMSGYTYNNADNVFSDGFAKEIATVTGSLSEGFELTKTIRVND